MSGCERGRGVLINLKLVPLLNDVLVEKSNVENFNGVHVLLGIVVDPAKHENRATVECTAAVVVTSDPKVGQVRPLVHLDVINFGGGAGLVDPGARDHDVLIRDGAGGVAVSLEAHVGAGAERVGVVFFVELPDFPQRLGVHVKLTAADHID